jgi:acyl transferase domain-containing protein
MGGDLLGVDSAFTETIAACDEIVGPRLGWTCAAMIERADTEILATIVGLQTMLFTVEVGLAAMWRARGLRCDAVAGTSLGEIAAAHVAGILTLDDALSIVLARSQLLESIGPEGGTVVINVDASESAALLDGLGGSAWISGFNGPGTTSFSGLDPALEELIRRGEERGVYTARVRIQYPAHSPLLMPLAEPLRTAIAGLQPRAGDTPFYSALTAGVVAGQDLTPDYWVRNLIDPVRGKDLLSALLHDRFDVIVEVTPHPIFAKPTNDAIAERRSTARHVATLRRNQPAGDMIAAAVAVIGQGGFAGGREHR